MFSAVMLLHCHLTCSVRQPQEVTDTLTDTLGVSHRLGLKAKKNPEMKHCDSF